MLGHVRVIDLTGERGAFGGFLLAQFGADVVLVEPAGGRPRDAIFDAYHRGKKSVIASSAEELDQLVGGADVVITDCSIDPLSPYLTTDLGRWRKLHPSLITVGITPFGSEGPKADWLATDLTLVASSGQMAVTGDDDRPPVRISIPQTWSHAGAQAAVGVLVALQHRHHTGLGQHVDVSAQQAACESAVPAILVSPAGLVPVERVAGGAKFGPQILRWVYECADGWAIITVSFGQMIGPKVAKFMQWVFAEGFCDEATRDKDYVDFALHIQQGIQPLSELARLIGIIETFAKTKTKAELLQRGLDESMLLAPVNNIADVLASPQLASRDFWEVHSDAASPCGEIRYPGPVVKSSAAPLAPLGVPAEPGQHTAHYLGSDRPIEPTAGPTVSGHAGAVELPLDGLKVCDLSWVAAGPLSTKILAFWGAAVVRIESVNRPCLLRQALGHLDDIPDQEGGITWHSVNANKLGVALDLSKPEALEVVRDLVAWADVVTESFTPGTVARWGLGYEDLRKIKPDIIMLSSCVMGQTGPYRDFAGFGNMSASVAGFFDVTGWPDRLPAGPYMAYTDYTSPRFTAAAVLAAVEHRRRTGEGQYLDFSQMEAATHFLAPAIVDYQRTGVMPTRRGNAADGIFPHGVYPSLGHDRWIAVVCETDQQWDLLAGLMRRPDLVGLTLAARLEQAESIETSLSAWTARQDAGGLQIRLQVHGIPAHQVQNSGECVNDPQLVHRRHFRWAPHPIAGQVMVDAMPYTLSRSSPEFRWGGPTYGQHTMEVLDEILGYDGERIAELAIAEVLE